MEHHLMLPPFVFVTLKFLLALHLRDDLDDRFVVGV